MNIIRNKNITKEKERHEETGNIINSLQNHLSILISKIYALVLNKNTLKRISKISSKLHCKKNKYKIY